MVVIPRFLIRIYTPDTERKDSYLAAEHLALCSFCRKFVMYEIYVI